MSKLEVGDLFVVVGCCPKCWQGQSRIGKVGTVTRLEYGAHGCANCKTIFESRIVYGSPTNICWPEFAVRKIEPLRKEEGILREEELLC